jgi:hypothetical protein
VNVVERAPACNAPCSAPAAPPSLCIAATAGTVPQIFVFPSADHWSAHSPMLEDGVIGYMAMTSLVWCATYAAASLPSMVTFGRLVVDELVNSPLPYQYWIRFPKTNYKT